MKRFGDISQRPGRRRLIQFLVFMILLAKLITVSEGEVHRINAGFPKTGNRRNLSFFSNRATMAQSSSGKPSVSGATNPPAASAPGIVKRPKAEAGRHPGSGGDSPDSDPPDPEPGRGDILYFTLTGKAVK
jgi:hypothetical protein